MPIRSIWFTDENETWLQQAKGDTKLNAVINSVLRYLRESDPSGESLQSILKSYAKKAG